MKPFILLLSAALLSTFSLNACTERNNMSVQEQTEARFKLNPEPKQPYRVKVKINNAPGPMKPINDMYIGYAARNCSYTISWLAGAKASPEKNIPIKMNLVGHDEYEVLFYADAVLDEDYFGEGVCQWKPENFGASFKATGKKEETEFNISDVMGNLEKEKTLTKYYWKRGYIRIIKIKTVYHMETKILLMWILVKKACPPMGQDLIMTMIFLVLPLL